jgi:hypothetical protein
MGLEFESCVNRSNIVSGCQFGTLAVETVCPLMNGNGAIYVLELEAEGKRDPH